MIGDKMYCKHCKKLFNDTWNMYDTRTHEKLITNCPFCLSKDTINATQYVEEYEKKKKHQFKSVKYGDEKLYLTIKDKLLSLNVLNVEKV